MSGETKTRAQRLANLDNLRQAREDIEKRIYSDSQLLRQLHEDIAAEVTALAEGR